MARPWIAILALAGCACTTQPEAYAPPGQREPFPAFRPYHSAGVIQMADADAETYFASDILGLNGTWRWTGRRPGVRLTPQTDQDLLYEIDFAIAEATFAETGPVKVSFWVDDHLLGELDCDQPGTRRFEHPVPPEWIEPGVAVVAAAEVDKVWVSPTDGVALGMILTSLGIKQDEPAAAESALQP